MCNQCINSLTFISRNYQKLKQLNRILDAVSVQKNGNTVNSLMAKHNYSNREIVILCDRRDYISDVDKFISNKGKSYYFHAETVSAWDPNLLPITTLLKERYNGEIKLISQSIEEGTGLFQTNDWTGMFYPEKFSVDLCSHENYDTQYFESWLEMIKYLESTFVEADISPLDSLNEIVEAIQDKYDDGSDESFFININMFTPYPNDSYSYYEEKEAA